MMDDTLQRLLDAETKAERIAQQADAARETTIQAAMQEAREAEQRFESRIAEIHAAFVEKAESRAAQSSAELVKRYDERRAKLREIAQQREAQALDDAFAALINTRADD